MSSISWWHQAVCLLFIEAICYSFLVSSRDKTWMKASWLELSIDKMKVMYGPGKENGFKLTKICFQSWGRFPLSKYTGDLLPPIFSWIPSYKSGPNPFLSLVSCLTLLTGSQLTSLCIQKVVRHTRSTKALLRLCHYFHMFPGLFIKMFGDKGTTPSRPTALYHGIPKEYRAFPND